ncbi:protein FAM177A1 isoform X1 [Oncorhynchus kisutch]|uniref:protein FAM177A1 isoform X1 n=1 Tax=Oncorhynchus kisutch TaxID=8019 RepID=UPI0009A04654|nr:protein FAM177A1-like isoform X1 [Oncorhynchus kisutch]
MAELSLYLTNVNISLGKTMDAEKSSNMVKEFESVELGDIGMKKQKVPRRTIYFASGETMEEYSTDEEEEEEVQASIAVKTSADPSRLTWGPYFLFHMWRVATSTISGKYGIMCTRLKIHTYECQNISYINVMFCVLVILCICLVLSVCDYLGERMASLFGITSPKYQYAIDEYYRMKKEEEEEEEENRLSEEAERRFEEEREQEMQQPAMEQPEGKASFVNVTFELDQDATSDANRFPAPIPT